MITTEIPAALGNSLTLVATFAFLHNNQQFRAAQWQRRFAATLIPCICLVGALLFPALAFTQGNMDTQKKVAVETTSPQLAEIRHLGVIYNSHLEMLSFPNRDVFQQAVSSLDRNLKAFKYDRGNTDSLLKALSAQQNDAALYNLLLASSPLSDQVLITFLKGAHPPAKVLAVLLANIDFSETVDNAYQQLSLPSEIRKQVDGQRFNHVPYTPVLDDFERSFPGFLSLKTKIDTAEMHFLSSGGDPESKKNPGNNNIFDRIIATVLNGRTEVQIGKSIYLMLPGRNIQLVNGDIKTLNYIRTHGDISKNAIPIKEPDNGLVVASAPYPIDPNIVVDPTITMRPNGCGVEISGGGNSNGRFTYSANANNKHLTYYWNFGDGYVSYKQSPVHVFADKTHIHTVTLTTYDEQGAGCNFGPVKTGGTTGTTGCSATFSSSASGLNATFSVIATGMPGYTFNWDFGDGSFATSFTSQTFHTYQSQGGYNVQLTMTDTQGCSVTTAGSISVYGSASSGGSKSCCDSRDKDREPWWKDSNGTHKFKHTLALHNGPFSRWIKAEVVTYRYTGITKHIGFWWWSKNLACVDVGGNIFPGNGPSTNKCGNAIPLSPPIVCADAIWHGNSSSFASKIYVEYNSVSSTGSAFGGSNFANISDCD